MGVAVSVAKIPVSPRVHCPDPSGGSLCRHTCEGPFALSAAEVTCGSCLRWTERVADAFEPAPTGERVQLSEDLIKALRACVAGPTQLSSEHAMTLHSLGLVKPYASDPSLYRATKLARWAMTEGIRLNPRS